MIRALQKNDIEPVMQLWLEGNTEAHAFIPKEYWLSNYPLVQEQILQAETYLYETNGEIQGFVGLVGNYIAGIFVARQYRSRGIGRQLLDHIKKLYSSLSLGVFQKNTQAVRFYLRENFTIVSEELDEDTGEVDCMMVWSGDGGVT